jgi:hypothetical protein
MALAKNMVGWKNINGKIPYAVINKEVRPLYGIYSVLKLQFQQEFDICKAVACTRLKLYHII